MPCSPGEPYYHGKILKPTLPSTHHSVGQFFSQIFWQRQNPFAFCFVSRPISSLALLAAVMDELTLGAGAQRAGQQRSVGTPEAKVASLPSFLVVENGNVGGVFENDVAGFERRNPRCRADGRRRRRSRHRVARG